MSFSLFVKILSIFVFCSFFGCTKKEERSTKEVHFFKLKEESYLLSRISVGDEDAYLRISKEYCLHGKEKELLFYSMIMAHEFESLQAYHDIHYIFSSGRGDFNSEKELSKLYLDKYNLLKNDIDNSNGNHR